MIGQAVSEMLEYYDNIHVYCPGVEADEPLGSNFFQNHKYSVHADFFMYFHYKPMTDNDAPGAWAV